jgi:hypothetical protein
VKQFLAFALGAFLSWLFTHQLTRHSSVGNPWFLDELDSYHEVAVGWKAGGGLRTISGLGTRGRRYFYVACETREQADELRQRLVAANDRFAVEWVRSQ